jgi:hypothetical protein
MAREKLHFIPEKGVDWLKPAHNPTGHLINILIKNGLSLKPKCFKN